MNMSDWILLQMLYECKNLTKASELLYLSQPTATKRLKALEREFGVQIAVRSRRGIEFTSEGEYLAAKAAQINNWMQDIRFNISKSDTEPEVFLSIGASNSMARYTLPSLLQSFHATHPHVKFEIQTALSSRILQMVEQGILDLGFINGDIPFRGDKLLYRVERGVLFSLEPLDIKQLSNRPYITYFKDPYTQTLIDQWWREHYFSKLPKGLTVQHGDICQELVFKGLGYSIFFTEGYMENHPEMMHPLSHRDGRPLTRNTWVIFAKDASKKAPVQQFIESTQPFPATSEPHL